MPENLAPFDFSSWMAELCVDITARLPEFQHIRMPQVAVTFAQTRIRVAHGLQAKLTPLRFEDGALTTKKLGKHWTLPRLYHKGEEILYILTFYLPRFLDHCLEEKFVTILHELYHISPVFNGDIRRLEGRYHVHSHSQDEYDAEMAMLARRYLSKNPPRYLYDFLMHDFRTLQRRYGGVIGLRVPIPKLIPLPAA